MGPVADNWLKAYRGTYRTYAEAADIAVTEISEMLSGFPVALHSISGRAKNPDSAAEKIIRKKYGRPKTQMTDAIGVRVIASYAQGVEEVVRRLRDKYDIDEKNSVDKRNDLKINEVGYRSVHMVLSLGRIGQTGDSAKLLTRTKIEVQVRSIVDHAWAEIEHQLRYKSGVELTTTMQRRFSALAGTLELVDQEFDNLSGGLVELVTKYAEQYVDLQIMEHEFDSARLLGFIIAKRPETVRLGTRGIPISFELASDCVRALHAVDLNTGSKLAIAIETQKFRNLVRDYADRRSVEPSQVSGLVVVACAIGLADPSVLLRNSFLNDSVIRSLLEVGV